MAAVLAARPPFLAELSPPIQPASATEEKTHPALSQTRIEPFKKHIYKAPGRAILIQEHHKKGSCIDPKPSVLLTYSKRNLVCITQTEFNHCRLS